MFTIRLEYGHRIIVAPVISGCQPQREIGVTVYNYETSVYVEDVQALTAEILAP